MKMKKRFSWFLFYIGYWFIYFSSLVDSDFCGKMLDKLFSIVYVIEEVEEE